MMEVCVKRNQSAELQRISMMQVLEEKTRFDEIKRAAKPNVSAEQNRMGGSDEGSGRSTISLPVYEDFSATGDELGAQSSECSSSSSAEKLVSARNGIYENEIEGYYWDFTSPKLLGSTEQHYIGPCPKMPPGVGPSSRLTEHRGPPRAYKPPLYNVDHQRQDFDHQSTESRISGTSVGTLRFDKNVNTPQSGITRFPLVSCTKGLIGHGNVSDSGTCSSAKDSESESMQEYKSAADQFSELDMLSSAKSSLQLDLYPALLSASKPCQKSGNQSSRSISNRSFRAVPAFPYIEEDVCKEGSAPNCNLGKGDLKPSAPSFEAATNAFQVESQSKLSLLPKPRGQLFDFDAIGAQQKHYSMLLDQNARLRWSTCQDLWQAVIAYIGCVRLCLRASARGLLKAPEFLLNDCSILRKSFGLDQVLLQPRGEERKRMAMDEVAALDTATGSRIHFGQVKVQVCKLKIYKGCESFSRSSLFGKAHFVQPQAHRKRSHVKLAWTALKTIGTTVRASSKQLLQSCNAAEASSPNPMSSSPSIRKRRTPFCHKMFVKENFSCMVNLKSLTDGKATPLQPGSSHAATFLLQHSNDEVVLEIYNSSKILCGQTTIQLAASCVNVLNQPCWWPVFSIHTNEYIGRVQLMITCKETSSDVDSEKWHCIRGSIAYDLVLEVALKAQRFGKRNVCLHGPWLWLLSEFVQCYGVSTAYANLRYMTCIMQVATPTKDCLMVIRELLRAVVKDRDNNNLDEREMQILASVECQVKRLLVNVFENYKVLDESSESGLSGASSPIIGSVVSVLSHAFELFSMLYDISSEGKQVLESYFQNAVNKRCKQHISETDELIGINKQDHLIDAASFAASYRKMKILCTQLKQEMHYDVQIQESLNLPCSINLVNLGAKIYGENFFQRLGDFLKYCPPASPCVPVVDLLTSAADLQKNLINCGFRSGNDEMVKDVFHSYVVSWIENKRVQMVGLCRVDKIRPAQLPTHRGIATFIEEICRIVSETFTELDVVIHLWPEHVTSLETVVVEVERAAISALERYYANDLRPLKDALITRAFFLQYVHKITGKHFSSFYTVSNQQGIVLNTMNCLLDKLQPLTEMKFRTWGQLLPPEYSNYVVGEQLSDVTITVLAKYKSYITAIVKKLSDNTKIQPATKMERILIEVRQAKGEIEVQQLLLPLRAQLMQTISMLNEVFVSPVFVAVCRAYWDHLAQEVFNYFMNWKDDKSTCRGPYYLLQMFEDMFASEMKVLQGKALQQRDIEPPPYAVEAQSLILRGLSDGRSSNYLCYH